MEITTSLTELLAAMIRTWKGIFAAMLVFALLLGGYQAYKQVALARDPKNSPEKIEERYQTALEDYETERESLQNTLENQEKSLASKEEYLEKSILLQIDPYNKYVADIVFTFSDIDESAQLFRYPNTAADYLPKKIRSQYLELWRSMDVSKDIGLTQYADVEWKYLSEIISVSSLEGELVSIRAAGAAASDAEKLADAVYRYFEAHRDVIARSSAQHNFALVNRTTKNVIDEDLNTQREALETEIEDLKKSIEESKQSIEDLTEPAREEEYSAAAIVKAVVKYAILGAAAGIVFACLFVCCQWLFSGRASNSFQLEEALSAPFLGSLNIPSALPARLAAAIMGERVWKEHEQAAAYIGEQAKANFPAGGKVLLLSTLPEKLAGAGMDELVAILSKKGYSVSSVMDAMHNPQAVEAIQACTAAVYVEMAGRSSLTAIRHSAAQLESSSVSILGIVTI